MTSSTIPNKILCDVCNKGRGSFKCEGCLRTFCPRHSTDHRNELNKQLEEIEVQHDLVQQILNQQTEDFRQHPLLKKIDQWEQTAIVKILRTAAEARKKLLKSTIEQTSDIKQTLKHISDELRQSREDNDFIETDLRKWTQKLEQLKTEILNSETIVIREVPTPLVTKIRIDRQDISDIFERVCGTARIEENGQLVVKDGLSKHTEIRGKGEYSISRHTFRFLVEQFVEDGWIFFGIISKSEPMQIASFYSPSSYGWSNKNQTYAGSRYIPGQTTEIFQNDTVILLIDCDQRKIELRNERSNRTIELSVDINKCPFPWTFHLNLEGANTHLRILNPSN